MRCINKRKQFVTIVLGISILLTGCTTPNYSKALRSYESSFQEDSYYEGSFFAEDLGVVTGKSPIVDNLPGSKDSGYPDTDEIYSSILVNTDSGEVLYAKSALKKLYPASTTKIITALVALEYGKDKLDDVVTVSEAAVDLPSDSSICELSAGDQLTLRDLITGLLIKSGNDAANAIAEYISGSVDGFVELMNKQAQAVGATSSHFMNPHGLHDEEHYTTAYDLYLIFQSCMKNEAFMEIIESDTYTATITNMNGVQRQATWLTTNQYKRGLVLSPSTVNVVGGKTGFTTPAGNCLVLLSNDSQADSQDHPYISIIMGAHGADTLYSEMTRLLEEVPRD